MWVCFFGEEQEEKRIQGKNYKVEEEKEMCEKIRERQETEQICEICKPFGKVATSTHSQVVTKYIARYQDEVRYPSGNVHLP